VAITSPKTSHWFLSSTEIPTCVVEPATKEDVAVALGVVGANKTPFAVMSGGHASNVGFSSVGTGGVHFWLGRLDTFEVDFERGSVQVGFGLVSFFLPFFHTLSFLFLPLFSSFFSSPFSLPSLDWNLDWERVLFEKKGEAICVVWCSVSSTDMRGKES